MNLTLVFCTQYNGVDLIPQDDVKITKKMQEAFDQVANTLPSMTYDMVEKFDYYLDEDQIDQLIAEAKRIIAHVIPDANIEFEYDTTST